jgi:hypothetical protein
MKYIVKKPKQGEKRVITKFLFLPLCLKNDCRWLESASILQKYWYGWENIKFV